MFAVAYESELVHAMFFDVCAYVSELHTCVRRVDVTARYMHVLHDVTIGVHHVDQGELFVTLFR